MSDEERDGEKTNQERTLNHREKNVGADDANTTSGDVVADV